MCKLFSKSGKQHLSASTGNSSCWSHEGTAGSSSTLSIRQNKMEALRGGAETPQEGLFTSHDL